jgi:N-acetylneuraminate synthase
MKDKMEIDGREIGPGEKPYIIAEISGNHNGDLARAKRMIKIAKDAGACAVKLQTYTADSLTIDSASSEFVLKEGTWKGRRLYDLYEEAHTPWEWFPELFSYAKGLGITVFSSVFDQPGIDFLEGLDAPAYKIASNELTDWPLVEATVKTGKPIIVSTGTASKQDVQDTINFIKEIGGSQLAVLHCVSAYPALPEESNLETMVDIRESFNVISGLSDHTLGTATSITAIAMGACIIEKHFTLDRNDGGPDSSFSLEPQELETLCHDAACAWQSVKGVKYGADADLLKRGVFTRQFWSTDDINIGDVLNSTNIKSIRAPSDAGGIRTKEYQVVYGRKAKVFIPKHSPITFNFIER